MTPCPEIKAHFPCPHYMGKDDRGDTVCMYDGALPCPGERHQIALTVKPWPPSEKVLEEVFK